MTQQSTSDAKQPPFAMSKGRLCAAFLAASAAILSTVGRADPSDRGKEGNWFVYEKTDNNTGERKVHASLAYVERFDADVVFVKMDCIRGEPLIQIDWYDKKAPQQAVVSIGAVQNPDDERAEKSYVFRKIDGLLGMGLMAAAEVSKEIIAHVGQSHTLPFRFIWTTRSRSSASIPKEPKERGTGSNDIARCNDIPRLLSSGPSLSKYSRLLVVT